MTDQSDCAVTGAGPSRWGASGLTRRGFLKASAATGLVALAGAGATSALAADNGVTSNSEEKVVPSPCRSNCHQGCQLDLHIRDGKLVRVSPHMGPEPEYNRICSKGYTHMFRTYSEQRTKYPLRRVAGTERGTNEWERITWDEAIDEITGKIKDAQNKYGSGAFTMFYWGSGNYGIANGTATPAYMDRFMAATGCTKTLIAVDMGSVQAQLRLGTFQRLPEARKMVDTKGFLFWGGNHVLSEIQCMHFYQEARDKGAKLICIDPNFSLTAAKCDQYIPIRPGTDGLLAIAMHQLIFENKWYDEEFLKTQTNAGALMFPEGVKLVHASDLGMDLEDDPVMCMSEGGAFEPVETCEDPVLFSEGKIAHGGKTLKTSLDFIKENGERYDMDDICGKTGIDYDTIVELTDFYAHNPTCVFTGYGSNHYMNANHTYLTMQMLPALVGQYNSEVAGMNCNPPGAGNLGYAGTVPPTVPEDAGPTIPTPLMHKAVTSGEWAGQPYHPEVLYIACCDLLNNMSDRNGAKEWLSKYDTIIVADPFMTDTALFADYILPVSFWFESDEIYNAVFGCAPMVHYGAQAIEPLYESKSDYEIYNLLLKGLGLNDAIIEDRDDWFRLCLDAEGNEELGLTLDNLKKQATLRGAPFVPYTPVGRFQFTQEKATPVWYDDQQLDMEAELTQPSWEPPVEAWPESELARKYPVQAISRRSRFRTHTQWWDVDVLNELDPEPHVMVNPATAKEYGVADGDMMRVYNDRGSFVARARYSNGTRPGTIFTSRGFQSSSYTEGHHQDILPRYCEDWVQNQCFYDTMVAIERA